MSSSIDARLVRLRDNRKSGAVDLALEALDLADDWIAAGRAIEDLASALEAMHPAIATVRNVAGEIRSSPANRAKRIAELRDSLRNGNRLIAVKVAEVIPVNAVVITLSNSSTVREALMACGPGCVYVMESNPGGEGAVMAEALRSSLTGKAGRKFVELIPDDSIGRYVPSCDCAIVGIDSFDGTGSIWHKVGTRPLAELCLRMGKPFYAAGQSLKRSNHKLDEDPPVDSETGVRLFDWTPGSLITRLITESE